MNVEGLIVTGGKSSRMGKNKALLLLDGRPVIQRLAEEMREAVGLVTLAVGTNPEAYRFLGCPMAQDSYPGAGPLAGLHAGLSHAQADWCLVSPCDLPFVTAEWFKALVREAQSAPAGTEVVLTKGDDRVHPLLAVYHTSVRGELENALKQHKYKVMDFVDTLQAKYVDFNLKDGEGKPGLSHSLTAFNMNRPEDYEEAVKLWQEWKMK